MTIKIKFAKYALVTASLLSLIGCSSTATSSISSVIQNRDKSYLTANSVAPLRVPPGISSATIQNQYPIADRSYPEASKKVSIMPPGLNDNS